jgi:superfamily II DNA or RNA helicase
VSPVDTTASPFVLHPYQAHTVAAHRAAHTGARRPTGTGPVNRTASTLATGLGKTVVAGQSTADSLARGERVIFAVHLRDLAFQARRTLHAMNRGASIGLVMGTEHNEWEADIVVASVPSIGTERQMLRRGIPADRFGLGIADECHHAAADTWQYAMGYFGAWRGMPWMGLTATLSRQDSRALGDTWSEIVADYDIGFGVRNQFLVKPVGRRIRVKSLMLDQVKMSRGSDFQDDDLGAAMEDADAGNAIAQAYLEHCPGKRAALFCPNVSTARRFADDLNEAGVATEVVTAATTTEERAAIYERFRLRTTMVISSVGVLTEGWDAPWCEVVIMARPTTSPALYIQCVGRGLRTWEPEGKRQCLVLDVVGVSENHRLVSLKDLAGKSSDPDDFFSSPYLDEDAPSERGEYQAPVKDYVEGELVSEEVDLFSDSTSMWLQTTGGVWFIPTSQAYWFLKPRKDGGFGLGRIPKDGGKVHVVEKDIDLMSGMAWATKYAEDEDPTVSVRNAPWRKRKQISEGMASWAQALGVPTEGLNQGQVSDLIAIGKASVVLRRFGS